MFEQYATKNGSKMIHELNNERKKLSFSSYAASSNHNLYRIKGIIRVFTQEVESPQVEFHLRIQKIVCMGR